MIGVVYLGSNPKTEERLRYIPGRLVQYTRNYKDAASACSTHVRNEHFILFYEQGDPTDDINAITYLKKKNKRIYIILLTKELSADDRLGYQKAGINDTLDSNASITELNKKIQFISDRENMLFDDQQPKYRMLRLDSHLEENLRCILRNLRTHYYLAHLHPYRYCHPSREQGPGNL